MCRIALLSALVFAFVPAKSQYAGYVPQPDKEAFARQFTTASGKVTSIKCDFTQEKTLGMLSEKIISRGKFWFRKENQVRMEYLQPFQYLLILSDNNVYIKDGERENKISAKSNQLFSQVNQVIIDCVRGSALDNPDFTVRIFEASQSYLIELSPANKSLKELFKNINIVVDKKNYTATRIEMYEQSGDNTVITFTNKELNTSIPDATFTIH